MELQLLLVQRVRFHELETAIARGALPELLVPQLLHKYRVGLDFILKLEQRYVRPVQPARVAQFLLLFLSLVMQDSTCPRMLLLALIVLLGSIARRLIFSLFLATWVLIVRPDRRPVLPALQDRHAPILPYPLCCVQTDIIRWEIRRTALTARRDRVVQ